MIENMIEDIERLVTCESPSEDLDAMARSADVVADLGSRLLSAPPERIVIDRRIHLRWRFGPSSRVLLLGHHDTVWPLGSLAEHPFEVRDGIMRGPGCLDMKAGIVMAMHAIASLDDRDGVTFLVTGDEEVGSPSSRTLIEDEARGCASALVLEASGAEGALKTERKGVSLYDMRIEGRAAHAGLDPERGVNATVEAAHQVLAVTALGDPAAGTTVTPTSLESGTTTNTVPADGRFAIDVRVRTTAEQDRVDRAMRALRPALPDARIHVTERLSRPPLQADASEKLFDRASRLAGALGLEPLVAVAVGGASDGNFTAGVGTPTLDGLGAVGGGAHAADEHVLVDRLEPRIRLLTALVAELLKEERP